MRERCSFFTTIVFFCWSRQLSRNMDTNLIALLIVRPTAHTTKLVNASARLRDKFMIERGIFKCIIYGALCVRFNLFMKWLILQYHHVEEIAPQPIHTFKMRFSIDCCHKLSLFRIDPPTKKTSSLIFVALIARIES